MSKEPECSAVLVSLQNSIKLQSTLLVRFEEREQHLRSTFARQMRALEDELAYLQRRIEGLVSTAGSQIGREARDAISPVAAEYDRAISNTTARLSSAARILALGFAATGATVLLVVLVGWAVAGYYHREVSVAKVELGRYENAIPVVQAFNASDATICGGRICINPDPKGQRAGEHRQYRQAKARPQ